MPTFDYIVDDEPQSTTSHELTANQILSNAGIDPSNHYLVEIRGKERVSYQDKGNTEIHMHEHMKFVSVSIAPTPVS